MPLEILPDRVGRPGVEKVNFSNWQDYYCGVHIHELRYHTTVPYLILTAAVTEYSVTIPFDFMFKLVKYEVKHTTNVNAERNASLVWSMSRSRETHLSGLQQEQRIVGGDTGPVSYLLVSFTEQYVYPPSNLKLTFYSDFAEDRVWPSLTVQVMY